MSVSNSASFLDLLRKSEVIDADTLERMEPELADEAEPMAMASRLVRDGWLTNWQAKFLLSGRHRLRVGKYFLLDRIAQDRLGDRFLGVHHHLDRKVDLQILPAGLSWQSDVMLL